jgi:hypothetical protein
MIEAVERGMPLFEDASDRAWLGRVLEDLSEMRDPAPPPPPRKPPPEDWPQIIKAVREASGGSLGLREAKQVCEEAGWWQGVAIAMARERTQQDG